MDFVEMPHKGWKNDDQERFQNKQRIQMDFWCQNGRPRRIKTRFSCDACSNLRGFTGSGNLMENWYQKSFNTQSVTAAPQDPRPFQVRRCVRGWWALTGVDSMRHAGRYCPCWHSKTGLAVVLCLSWNLYPGGFSLKPGPPDAEKIGVRFP